MRGVLFLSISLLIVLQLAYCEEIDIDLIKVPNCNNIKIKIRYN